MKTCTKCGIEKDESEFHKRSAATISGVVSQCKSCVLKKSKIYYEKNKEKIKEYSRNYFKNNRERCNKTSKKWRNKNKDKLRKLKMISYYKNHENCLLQRKHWAEKNAEKVKNLNKSRSIELPDSYIDQQLSLKIEPELITSELRELKRIHIKLKRFINNKKKEATQ